MSAEEEFDSRLSRLERRTRAPLPRPSAPDAALELLREIRDELRSLRGDLRRKPADTKVFLAALEAEFGPGRFTVAGLLGLCTDDPHSDLAAAVDDLIDMNAVPRARATALGALLRKLPEVETVAEQRGCAVYRLRT